MSDHEKTTKRSWLVAHRRWLRVRSRLSFMLLDIFLGGFVVGIVLMITLGRPAETDAARGAGGETFMAIDVYWEDPDVILAPVLQFNPGNGFQSLSRFGLSSIWEGTTSAASIWPTYDKTTGELALAAPFSKGVHADGFDPRHDSVRMQRARQVGEEVKDLNFGQIWISEPFSGCWRVGIRVIETPATIDPDTQLRIWIDVTTGVNSAPAAYPTIEQIAAQPDRKSGEIFFPMTMSGNAHFVTIVVPNDQSEPAAHCSP